MVVAAIPEQHGQANNKGLLMGSTPMGSARKPCKNEIFEFGSRFWSDFVFFDPGEVGDV